MVYPISLVSIPTDLLVVKIQCFIRLEHLTFVTENNYLSTIWSNDGSGNQPE